MIKELKMIKIKFYYCFLFILVFTTSAFSQSGEIESDTIKKDVLDEVIVVGKSKVREINESAYNVVSIDTRLLHNTTLNLTQTLDRISGVKIRETGGVGSEAQISINGFSGRHIKVFMDGMPMEGFGSSFQLNNMPVNLAERIEVYKGVVPVEFGSDALGGAINIVTKQTKNTYLDVSYSYGSFNTHKSNISFGHTTQNGFIFQLNAYQNYSDNNYKVKTNLLDFASSHYSKEEYWFRRFHDNYHNEAVIAKVGVVNKSWADRLLIGLTLSQEKADIQHANLMQIAYGGRERKARSIIPTLNYEKRNLFVQNLNFSLTANYNNAKNNNLDTLSRRYNWKGEYEPRKTKGESGQYSLSEFYNRNVYVTANLNYRISNKHYFALNNLYSNYTRKATDAAANSENSTAATFMRRTNAKNVLGFSYRFEPSKRWNTSAFFKYYEVNVRGPIDVSTTSTAVYEEREKSFSTTGYGIMMTYFLTETFQVKASFEDAYRLPSERELFGDEVLETGDASLKPENSRNINFNVSYSNVWHNTHSAYIDIGLIYRDTRDYIRRQIEQRYGGAFYTNHGKVLNIGIDAEARYFYKNIFSAGGNITYQNIRSMEKYKANGEIDINYKGRMPNLPYIFGNIDASYNINNAFGKGNILSLGYNLRYIHSFLRSWISEGAYRTIPMQLSHDVNLTYTLQNGRYNISFEIKNIADKMQFDNYHLQKPGRSFTIKLRYFFFNNNYK
ncbi:MAG: TonB-dependent receptor plug domain-containing protein [Prevotellaceae bacterium]|jgi:outer membrane receptor protein involved in Fe transport|nr:TonB-dependent receptor plug domain-containing protein [Prevotellaceae bacterium]